MVEPAASKTSDAVSTENDLVTEKNAFLFWDKYLNEHQKVVSSYGDRIRCITALEAVILATRQILMDCKQKEDTDKISKRIMSKLAWLSLQYCQDKFWLVPPELLAVVASIHVQDAPWDANDWEEFFDRAKTLASNFVRTLDDCSLVRAYWMERESSDTIGSSTLSSPGKDMHKLVQQMNRNGLWVETGVSGLSQWFYTSVLGALCKKTDSQKFWRIWDEMIADGLHPDSKCYALAMRLSINICDYSTLFSLYDDVLLSNNEVTLQSGMFDHLLRACSQTKNIEGAKQIWFDMMRLGVVPSVTTWEEYLKCAVNSSDNELATNILTDMRRNNYEFSHEIYFQSLRLCQKEQDFDKAVKIFKSMRNEGLEPSSRFLEGLLRIAHDANAYDVVKRLKATIQKRSSHDMLYLETVLAWETHVASRNRFYEALGAERYQYPSAAPARKGSVGNDEQLHSWTGSALSTASLPTMSPNISNGNVVRQLSVLNDAVWASVWCSAKARYIDFTNHISGVHELYRSLSKSLSNASLLQAVFPVSPYVWYQHPWNYCVSNPNTSACPSFDPGHYPYGWSAVYTFYKGYYFPRDNVFIKRFRRPEKYYRERKKQWTGTVLASPIFLGETHPYNRLVADSAVKTVSRSSTHPYWLETYLHNCAATAMVIPVE